MFKFITLACLVSAVFGAGHLSHFETLPQAQSGWSQYSSEGGSIAGGEYLVNSEAGAAEAGFVEGGASYEAGAISGDAAISGGAISGGAIGGGEVVVDGAAGAGEVVADGAPVVSESGFTSVSSGVINAAAPAVSVSTGSAAPSFFSAAGPAVIGAAGPAVQTQTFVGQAPAFTSSLIGGAAAPALIGLGATPARVVSYTAGAPAVQHYTANAPGFVRNIYADRSHVHPGEEKVFRYRTPAKIRKEVAVVGRVVQQPKIKVLQVVKQPNIRKYTVLQKPQKKIVNVLPAQVSHITRVYKAPEAVYKTRNWYAAKQRETSGNIVSIERSKIAPEGYWESGSSVTLPGFEGSQWELTANAGNLAGDAAAAANAAANAAAAAGAAVETKQLNLGQGATGYQTVARGADGSTTTTTTFHASSGSGVQPLGSLDAGFSREDTQIKSELTKKK